MPTADQVVSELILRARTEGFQQAVNDTDRLTRSQESAIKAAERQTKAWDAQARSQAQLEQGARTYVRLQEQGLANTETATRHLQALTMATEKHTKAFNDNAHGLRSHEWVNFSRQLQDVAVGLYSGQHAMTVFAQQGAQMFDILASRQGGFMSGVKALGESLLGLVTPGRLFGAAVVGSLAAIEIGASMAQSKLTELGKQARETGISASGIRGAQAVGAGAGLSGEETNAALASAAKQFEQFKRNSGDVLEFFKKFDASALPAIDKAKSFNEWLGQIGNEIQRLGGEQGTDLTQRLFGADQGKALADNVGEFLKSIQKVPDSIDAAAAAADGLSRELAQANSEVDTKLLGAFAEVKALSSDIAHIWLSIKSMFADFVSAAGKAYNTVRSYIPDWTSPTGFLMTPHQLPDIDVGGRKSVGATRALYPDTAKKGGGKSDAEKEQEKYDKIVADLEQQLKLVNLTGEAHKEMQYQIEKENWLEKLGTDASAEHKKHVEELAEKLRAAHVEQERLTKATQAFNEAYQSVANTISGAFKDILLNGTKPADALKKMAQSIQGGLFDSVLTGSGPFAKMLGLNGENGAVGGLFGALSSLAGLPGGKSVQQMNVQAANVILNGGALSGLGGALSGLFGGGGPQMVTGGAGSLAVPTFADGGIMTSRGPVPLRRYAGGGVASSPQLALFGEGSGPEAFVPLSGGRIPVKIDGAHGGGQAAPVTVNLIGAPAGAQVKQETAQNGSRRIDVIFDDRAAQSLKSPQASTAMRATYGLTTRVAQR